MTDYIALATSLVKRLEGCVLTGYLDTADHATNGYGHTGPEVKVGVTITQEIADHDLAVDLGIADNRLKAVCKLEALDALHQHQRATLLSFVFNVGAEPGWTIWKDIDAGNLADVPAQLMRFDKEHQPGGAVVTVPGLEHRRTAEVIFWNTGDEDVAVSVTQTANAVPAPPSGYTRIAVTPPMPVPPPPAAKVSLSAKVATAALGLGATASQLHGIVAPHMDENPIFQHMAVACSAGVVIAGCVGVLIHTNQAEARNQ